jgi:hypothetical protein
MMWGAVPVDPVAGPRTGRRRDRRGRGMRGRAVLPGPLTPGGVPGGKSRRDRFDAAVIDALSLLEERWSDELGLVEFAVEEAPLVPDDWTAATVPLTTLVRGEDGAPTRLVVFRRPIELRCETSADLDALVFTVLVEQVAELLGRRPEEIDPRYDG